MKLSSKTQTIISWSPLVIFIMVIVVYALNHFVGPYDQFWADQKKEINKKRTIASFKDHLEFDAYRDYFLTNSFNKYLNFKMTTGFWTDKESEGLRRKANVALHNSFIQTFEEQSNSSSSVSELFKKSIVENSISKFVNTLYLFEVMNGKFQIDMNFTPQFIQNLTYENELSSNQLVDIKRLNLKEELKEISKSQIQTIIETPIPHVNEKYQYSGGSISIQLNIIDLKWNPKKSMIDPKNSSLNGHIRFRRYYRANKLSDLGLDIEGKTLKVEMFQLRKKEGESNNYITVDLYKTFDLNNMSPKRDRIEINFGKLLSNSPKNGTWLRNVFDDREDHYETGDLYLHGKYKSHATTIKTQVKLEKLIYSFKEKSFSKKSKIIVLLKGRIPTHINRSREKFNIKKELREDLADKIVKSLKLDHFYGNLDTSGVSR
ncbi:hypothetical protein A9Q84_08045 [Halobacteriovorax marinus]|uniref:Uncharacterized protein n=1 Tax=Halobacteriovorax marinus TaxID=97084 RepID=A0A1Y5FBE9_9BACT|nr:hypothetical protein A9Q84_08045 [Halobacteriovorax marinus]